MNNSPIGSYRRTLVTRRPCLVTYYRNSARAGGYCATANRATPTWYFAAGERVARRGEDGESSCCMLPRHRSIVPTDYRSCYSCRCITTCTVSGSSGICADVHDARAHDLCRLCQSWPLLSPLLSMHAHSPVLKRYTTYDFELRPAKVFDLFFPVNLH